MQEAVPYTVLPANVSSPYYSYVAGGGLGFQEGTNPPFIFAGVTYTITAFGYDDFGNQQQGIDPGFVLNEGDWIELWRGYYMQ